VYIFVFKLDSIFKTMYSLELPNYQMIHMFLFTLLCSDGQTTFLKANFPWITEYIIIVAPHIKLKDKFKRMRLHSKQKL